MRIILLTVMIIGILLTCQSAGGATRQQGILDFVDATRLSDSGFANTPTGEITLESTYHAMQIKTYLNDEINNSLDILYFIQTLQNSSGGFSQTENSEVTLEATITAVKSFQYLDLNQTQFSRWEIFPYLNETAINQLLIPGEPLPELQNLTIARLYLWYDFLLTSSKLGYLVSFPILELIDAVKNLQYSNGSYPDFYTALGSVHLLSILGEEPNDLDLASKFIQTFITSNGAFSDTYGGQSSLKATYFALDVLSKIIDLNQFEFKTDITRFIFSQQQSRSGFIEVEDGEVTMTATFYAVNILTLLNNLFELNAPDVLQEVGFVDSPHIVYFISVSLVVYLVRRRLNE